MEIVFVIVGMFFGSILARFFLFTEVSDIILSKESLTRFVYKVIPFSSFLISNQYKKERQVSIITEIIGMVSLGLFFAGYISLYKNNFENELGNALLFFLIYGVIIVGLLYLAIYDVVHFAIPEVWGKRIIFWVLFCNIFIAIVSLLSSSVSWLELLNLYPLGTFSAIGGGLLLFSIPLFLVYVTKEKAMGAGDADVFLFVGLSLGIVKSASFFLLTVFTGTLIGLLYALYVRKFKNVMIPFVPIILIGYVLALFWSEDFIDLVTLY